MKICRNCGKLSNDDVRMCPACGLTLENRKKIKKTREEEDAQNKIMVKPTSESQKDKLNLKPISANSDAKESDDTLEIIPVQSPANKPTGPSGMVFGMNSGVFPLSTKKPSEPNKEPTSLKYPLEEDSDDSLDDSMKPMSSVTPDFPLIPIKPSENIKIIATEKKESFIPLEIRVRMEKEAKLKTDQSKDSVSKSTPSKDAGSKDAGSKDAGSKDAGSKDEEEPTNPIRFPKRKIIVNQSSQQNKVQPVSQNLVNVVTQEGFTEYIPESKLDQDLTQEKDIAELASLLDDDLKQEASPVSEDASDAQISFPKRRFQGFKGIKTFIDAPVVGTSVNASSILENQAGITLQSHSHVLSTGAASTISISELMKNAIQDLSSKFTPSNKAVEKNEKVKPAPTAKTATPNSLLSLLKQISELDPAIEACGIIKGGEIAASAISSRLNNELAKEAIGAVLTVCDKYSNSMRMGQIMTVSITSQYGIFHIAEVQSGVFMYILTGSDTKQGLFNVVLKKIRSEIGRFL